MKILVTVVMGQIHSAMIGNYGLQTKTITGELTVPSGGSARETVDTYISRVRDVASRDQVMSVAHSILPD